MKLLTRLADAFPSRWLDWRRRDVRDAVVIAGLAIFAFVVGTINDLTLALFQFGVAHADQEADDIIFVVFILGIAMTVFGFRRYQDLSREIKARIAAEWDARDQARHDPLTGLPNRRFFDEKLDEYLGAASAIHRMAVLMLDLDGFKAVNDTYGHSAGDKALSEFSRRVSNVLRSGTFLARIGGDEFAIIKPKIDSLDEVTNLA